MPSGSRRTRHRAPRARSPINRPRHAPEPQRIEQRTGTAAEHLPEPRRAPEKDRSERTAGAPHASPRTSEDPPGARERLPDQDAAQHYNCAYNAKQPPGKGGYFLRVRQFAHMRTGNADRGKTAKIASGAIVRQLYTNLLCKRENLQFSRKFHKFRNCQNQAKSCIMEP